MGTIGKMYRQKLKNVLRVLMWAIKVE